MTRKPSTPQPQRPVNYALFYELARQACSSGHLSTDEFKTMMVLQFTQNRTFHLHEMSLVEYNTMCTAIAKQQRGTSQNQLLANNLRRARGRVLGLIERWGIDTKQYAKVDEFCLQSRIAGKRFVRLTTDELNHLYRKLTAMITQRDKRQLDQTIAADQ